MGIEGDPRVQKLNLQPLLERLGVRGITVHDYSPHVVPVALVDGAISAAPLQALDVPFTAGEVTAPAANTRLANTGPLVAGQYNLTFMLSAGENNTYRLRRRNAGDTADVWAQRFIGGQAGGGNTLLGPLMVALRVALLVNEFIVLENVGGGAVGVVYQASIWVQGPF
jgi:hypothetical protein